MGTAELSEIALLASVLSGLTNPKPKQDAPVEDKIRASYLRSEAKWARDALWPAMLEVCKSSTKYTDRDFLECEPDNAVFHCCAICLVKVGVWEDWDPPLPHSPECSVRLLSDAINAHFVIRYADDEHEGLHDG